MMRKGDVLQIFVENQGRINHGPFLVGDFKGLVGEVKLNGVSLQGGWNSTGMPFDTTGDELLRELRHEFSWGTSGPRDELGFWHGSFKAGCEDGSPGQDTFLSLPGWWKGVAFINGRNLGRYWPVVGPQRTLYVPSVYIQGECEVNEVLLFEQERPGCAEVEDGSPGRVDYEKCEVKFVTVPDIDGPTPAVSFFDQELFQEEDDMYSLKGL